MTRKHCDEVDAILLSLAARTGIIRYLNTNSNFQSCDSLTKHTLVLHALDSWNDNPQRISLQDRTETLQFLLQGVLLEDDTSRTRVMWISALKIGGTMVNNKPVECAELLRSFLTTTPNRKALMAGNIIDTGFEDPWTLIRELRSQRKLLADELERLVTANFSSDVSSKYLDEISDESVTLSRTFKRPQYRQGRRAPGASVQASGTLEAPGAPRMKPSLPYSYIPHAPLFPSANYAYNASPSYYPPRVDLNTSHRFTETRYEMTHREANVFPYYPTTVNCQHLDRDCPHRTNGHMFHSQNHEPSRTEPHPHPSAEIWDSSSEPFSIGPPAIATLSAPWEPSQGKDLRETHTSLDARQSLSTKPAEDPRQIWQNNDAPPNTCLGQPGMESGALKYPHRARSGSI